MVEAPGAVTGQMESCPVPELSKEEIAAVDRAQRWLGEVQKATTDALWMGTVRTLLMVAVNPGITPNELANRMGKTRGLASRQLLDLGIKRRQQTGGKEDGDPNGFGLVEPFPDLSDLRLRRYRCTPKGYGLARRLARLMSSTAGDSSRSCREERIWLCTSAPEIAPKGLWPSPRSPRA